MKNGASANLDLLDRAFVSSGAAAWGGMPFERLEMAPDALEKARSLVPGAQAVLVAAYPYFAGDRPGNLSLYARGEDYHLVLTRALNTVCDYLKAEYPESCFLPGADNSPLPEIQAAWRAGVGVRGAHGLLILPPYGSYVFLGTILTDAPLVFPEVPPAPDCIGCGACAAACPSGALGPDGFQADRCLSHLTQKKGALTEAESALVAVHPYAWGCDLCQKVCPYNREPRKTTLAAFQQDLIDSLTPDMVEGETNRSFRAKYGERAFAWRGPAVIRRNLALQAGRRGP